MHQMTADVLAENPKATFNCQCCDKKLKNHETIMWATLTTSGEWFKLTATVPEEEDQGAFPLGAGCYKALKPKG